MNSEPLQIGYARQRRYDGVQPPRRRAALESVHWLGDALIWSFAVLILIGVPLGGVFTVTGPVLGFPYLVLGVLMMPVLAAAARSVRRRRATAVLGYLQQAIRLNLPLTRFLAAAAGSERGRLSVEIMQLRHALEGGTSLADALASTVRELPQRSIALIDYAEQTGKLPETLDRLVLENVGESRKVRENRAVVAWYPQLVLVIGCAVIWVLDQFVFPKFTYLFHDFNLPLPALTRWLLHATDWLVWLVPILLTPVLYMCAMRFREAVTQRRSSWLFRPITDRLLWMLPLSHGMIRDRAMTDLCTALADSVELGYPLDQALFRAQQLELNLIVKRRMERWGGELAKGRSPADAAAAADMPQLLVGMLAPAKDASTIGQVLRFLARHYSSRFLLGRELARGAFLPVVTLMMGIAVGVVALAMFLPLERLINSLDYGGR